VACHQLVESTHVARVASVATGMMLVAV
jgi:hypothetical protein